MILGYEGNSQMDALSPSASPCTLFLELRVVGGGPRARMPIEICQDGHPPPSKATDVHRRLLWHELVEGEPVCR
jgi:hypothetical protein